MHSLVEMFFDVDDFCHEFLRQCEQKLLSNQGLFFISFISTLEELSSTELYFLAYNINEDLMD